MKTWFITGAARGIGRLVSELALSQGDNVVVTARSPERARMIGDAGAKSLVLPLDVTDALQADQAARKAIERFGRIDILLNNAGFGMIGAVEEASGAEIEALYRTNVFGLLNVTRAVLPYMRRQRSGRVLNISSIGGYRGGAGFGVYCSTKFAVEGLSEALHQELAPLGIGVTIIEPGYFRTDFLDPSSLKTSDTVIADYQDTAGAVRSRAITANHQQPGDPNALAHAIVTVAKHPEPPLRLPVGRDTVAAIEAKHVADQEIIKKWRNLSTGTDLVTK